MAFRSLLVKRAQALSVSTRIIGPSHCLRVFSSTALSKSEQKEKGYPIDPLIADALTEQNKRTPSRAVRLKKIADSFVFERELPPVDQWTPLFPWCQENKSRSSVYNLETCKKLAEAFVPEGSKGKVVLEAFPGPGSLSRALLALPRERIDKLIIMEDSDYFLNALRPLESDPRVQIIPASGYSWEAYDTIQSLGFFEDIEIEDWSNEHSRLKFISHIPHRVHGEQLVSQFFRSIPDRQWLFKYGRIPLHFVMSVALWQRISSSIQDAGSRCKLSVIAEATVSCTPTIPPEDLLPYKDHFFPTKYAHAMDYLAINVEPLKKQLIEKGTMDEWDYCLRRLFVQKATPIKSSLPALAPGAGSILKKITAESLPANERLNPKTPPRKLTVQEWKILIDTFTDWPFKPDDLSISNFQIVSRQETRVM